MTLSGESDQKKSANPRSPNSSSKQDPLLCFDGHTHQRLPRKIGSSSRTPSSKPHRCRESGCNKRYARKGDLRRHERESHRDSQLKCPVLGCGRAFKRLHRLVEHLRKPCGDFSANWHPKIAGSTQAEIVIHDHNQKATRGEVVFDVAGHMQVHEDQVNVGVTIECGHGMKIMAKHLQYFVHFACPLGLCRGSQEQQAFFHAGVWPHEAGLRLHLRESHDMGFDQAYKLALEVETAAVAAAASPALDDVEGQLRL